MGVWCTALVLLLFKLTSVHPRCSMCTESCGQLQPSYANLTGDISISCTQSDQSVKTLFLKQEFKYVRSLSITTPDLALLNLTGLSNVEGITLAYNKIRSVDLTYFKSVKHLDLSNNKISQLNVVNSQLTSLDLSHNLIVNITKIEIKSPKLLHLNLSSNSIETTNNFSSESLKHLDLSSNKIHTIQFASLPNLRTLNLSSNSISFINNTTFHSSPSLEVLDLSRNLLTDLSDLSFNITNLLKLDLRKNTIKTLSQKCFYGLNKLQFLDLSSNKLKLIPPRTIQYLSGLLQLIIADNKELSSQDFGLLLATRRLKSVDASKTNQVKIPSSLTRSVRFLTLRENNVTQIQSGDLDSYPLLNMLDLSDNKINCIEDDALGRLELLSTLILTNNQLTSIPHTLPTNLKHLILSKNQINQISGVEFNGMTQLKSLDLSNNNMSNITDNSFNQLFMLEKLNLSGNVIKLLSTSTFLGLRKLKILDLSNMKHVTKCEQALCFPIPESNQIQILNLQNSPALSHRLLNDIAALKTLKELTELNMGYSNISEIRQDLMTFLPRLSKLILDGNNLNCSSLRLIHSYVNSVKIDNCKFKFEVTTVKPTIKSTMVTTTIPQITSSTAQKTTVRVIPEETLTVTTVQTNYTHDTTSSTQVPTKAISTTDTTTEVEKINDIVTENDEITMFNNSDDSLYSNEIWMKDSGPGMVYALSSEVPSSHPGLFVLLLLPLALVSTCLLINYSRTKRQHTRQIQYEVDMEIPNISNELW